MKDLINNTPILLLGELVVSADFVQNQQCGTLRFQLLRREALRLGA